MRNSFLALALASAAPAMAAEDPAPFIGRYTFDTDHLAQSGCIVTLVATGQNGRFDLTLAEPCARQFPFLTDIAGWSPHGFGFSFSYRRGGVAIDFYDAAQNQFIGPYTPEHGGNGAFYIMARFPDTPDDIRLKASVYSGDWWLAASGDKDAARCDVKLMARRDDPWPYPIELSDACAAIAPFTQDVRGWMPDKPEGFALTDAAGKTINAFAWQDEDVFGSAGHPFVLIRHWPE